MSTLNATGSVSSIETPKTPSLFRTTVGQVVQLRFVREVFSPPSPLVGKRMPFQDAYPSLAKKFLDAYALISEGENVKARVLFLKLQTELEEEAPEALKGVRSILPASCMLGLAFTYPDNIAEGIRLKDEAKQEIDRLYENRASWDTLDNTEKKIGYATFLTEFRSLLTWTSLENQPARDEIKSKIQECEKTLKLLRASSKSDPKNIPPKQVTFPPITDPTTLEKTYTVTFIALPPVMTAVALYNRFLVKK